MVKTITASLLEAIKDSGLSRYQIAKRVGISESALSRFVTGKRGLDLISADKLAVFFQLELRSVAPQSNRR